MFEISQFKATCMDIYLIDNSRNVDHCILDL